MVQALTGMVPLVVAGGVATHFTDRALGPRESRPEPEKKRQPAVGLSASEQQQLLQAVTRLKMTATRARSLRKSGIKVLTLAQAKKTVSRLERKRAVGGLRARRGL